VIEKEAGVKNFDEIRHQIDGLEGIVATTPYIHGSIFLESDGQAQGIGIRGIDPKTESSVTKIKEYLMKGKLEDLQGDGVILGSELAVYHGFDVGDKVTAIAPASGLAGEGWRYELKVVGIFTSGMYDYDMNLILVNLAKAQEIFDFPRDTVTGVSVKLKDIYKAAEVKKRIQKFLGYRFIVRTWIEANSNFFAALRLEKFAMFVILTLIVLVASFNIVSTLIVTVTSKIKDIGILKSIGVPKNSIRRIFTLEGLCLGAIGTFWGLVGGVGLSLALKKYQFIKLPADIYYVDRLPIVLDLVDIFTIVAAAILISFLATLYPAVKAASLEPVEALRYE
jgi:lipoprotein-releasing system permease protein